MLKKTCLSLIIVLMMVTVSSARVYEGVDMPETLSVGDYTLALNGVGMRVAMMVIKPYVLGLYLMEAEKDGAAIMKADEPMELRLVTIESVTRSMLLSKLYDGMHNSVESTGGSFDAIKDRFEKFKGLFPDAKFEKGVICEFKYLPGKGLQVYKNGQLLGVIDGLDFKEAFFGIWLNKDKPADEPLKVAMLSGDVSQQARDEQKQHSTKVKIEKETKLAESDAKAKAVAEAETQKKPAAEKASAAEPEAAVVAAAEMPKAPVAAGKAAEAKAPMSAASIQMSGDSALAAAYLVNALKSAELTAALNGDKFDTEKESQNIIQLWKKMAREISK